MIYQIFILTLSFIMITVSRPLHAVPRISRIELGAFFDFFWISCITCSQKASDARLLIEPININESFEHWREVRPSTISDFDFWREKNTKCPILVFSARVITIHSMRRSAAVIKLLSFSSLPSCGIFDAEVDH